jgi:preprotein translocase subunit SecG
MMTTYLIAALLAAVLFSAFVLLHRPDCYGASCESGASCGGCPKSPFQREHPDA